LNLAFLIIRNRRVCQGNVDSSYTLVDLFHGNDAEATFTAPYLVGIKLRLLQFKGRFTCEMKTRNVGDAVEHAAHATAVVVG
jgi:hypothetical protein